MSADVNDRRPSVRYLRDVAELAGVSSATASRVLSGSTHPVSTETRRRVLAAAKELDFQPNRLARALATARSQTIGVIVHDVSDPYFAGIVRGLEDVASARDHALFVANSDRDPAKELDVLRAFESHRVDAIVQAASGLTDALEAPEMRTVLDRYTERGGVIVSMSEKPYGSARVRFDNVEAMASITGHLVSLGHRRIGLLTGPPGLEISATRAEGYRRALERAGIAFDEGLVETGWFTIEGGADATRLLYARRRPTAIVAANDLMAIGAMRCLMDRGVRVPHDVSVGGFDDIEFAAYAPVPLTTVRVPLREFGRLAARLAFELLDGTPPARWPEIRPELVLRDSTGPVKTG